MDPPLILIARNASLTEASLREHARGEGFESSSSHVPLTSIKLFLVNDILYLLRCFKFFVCYVLSGMNMRPSQLNRNLSNCEIARKKKGFSGLQRFEPEAFAFALAAVLYQLSYEDPYTCKYRGFAPIPRDPVNKGHGSRASGTNKRSFGESFVYVHQHSGDGVTWKPSIFRILSLILCMLLYYLFIIMFLYYLSE